MTPEQADNLFKPLVPCKCRENPEAPESKTGASPVFRTILDLRVTKPSWTTSLRKEKGVQTPDENIGKDSASSKAAFIEAEYKDSLATLLRTANHVGEVQGKLAIIARKMTAACATLNELNMDSSSSVAMKQAFGNRELRVCAEELSELVQERKRLQRLSRMLHRCYSEASSEFKHYSETDFRNTQRRLFTSPIGHGTCPQLSPIGSEWNSQKVNEQSALFLWGPQGLAKQTGQGHSDTTCSGEDKSTTEHGTTMHDTSS